MTVTTKSLHKSVDEDIERALVSRAQQGDTGAIEDLVRIFQPVVFNIVLRMVPDFHEAEDLCQEIMLKSVIKIGLFRGDSRFGTWIYRIAVNHVLNIKKTSSEKYHEKYLRNPPDDAGMERYFDQGIADPKTIPVELALLTKEVMIKCMLGMLLCLNRKHRIVFILGHILEVNGAAASAILDMSEENYRKTLSRARNKLFSFLNDRCSLVNPGKPCTCERCVAPSIRNGYVDPLKLVFNRPDAPAIREVVSDIRMKFDTVVSAGWVDLYASQPRQDSPDISQKVAQILNHSDLKTFFDTAEK